MAPAEDSRRTAGTEAAALGALRVEEAEDLVAGEAVVAALGDLLADDRVHESPGGAQFELALLIYSSGRRA
ncbi:hypothetical protein ACFT8P_33385 [Streptomyces sp. NPDC057101]|uniref:hypothetical protein n=1 Tax=Streptomyces sp. NPDC057101 TaxID=3346020 RepID=UPI003641C017